jgi:hypothetical protein
LLNKRDGEGRTFAVFLFFAGIRECPLWLVDIQIVSANVCFLGKADMPKLAKLAAYDPKRT